MRTKAMAATAAGMMIIVASTGAALAAAPTHDLTVTTKLVKSFSYKHNEITLEELTDHGGIVGTGEGDCVLGSTIRYSAAYALTGGMIDARVVTMKASEQATITGGSGRYANARGTLHIEHESRTSLRLQFRYAT